MDNIKIGLAITELRKRQGYTQKELADKLMVSDKAVSKWERGLGLPDISILSTLAMVLDSDVESILEGNDKPYVKEEWYGILNLLNCEIDLTKNIYDKPLLSYQIGYFMLAGIKSIQIVCDSNIEEYIRKITKKININIQTYNKPFIDENCNYMLINSPLFLYGQNITRTFQKAMGRKDGITVLSLPEHINNNIGIVYDSMHKVTKDDENSIETSYNYNALPVMFYPHKYSNQLHISDIRKMIEECTNNGMLFTEPMFRGIIYIPLFANEDVKDSEKMVEIIQKRDYPIGDLQEIEQRRGLK